MNTPERIRIDKWLWAARFYKTRQLAVAAIEAGQVRWLHMGEDHRIKASKEVRVGDVYRIMRSGERWQLTVSAVTDKRGNATLAAAMYVEDDAVRSERELARQANKHSLDDVLKVRPTKRDRRALMDFLANP